MRKLKLPVAVVKFPQIGFWRMCILDPMQEQDSGYQFVSPRERCDARACSRVGNRPNDPAYAETVAEFYAGKTITITVGFSPGGGYDLYARLVAQFLGRYIPGRPTVIVSNMPGGGGLRAAIQLFNAAPKDGTVLTAIVQSVGFDSALGQLPVPADQFNYIGRMTNSIEMQLMWHTSPTKSLEDAKSRRTVIGATGTSSPSTIVPKLLNDVIGTKFNIVGGYPGTSDSALAMERGEVEGTLQESQISGRHKSRLVDQR